MGERVLIQSMLRNGLEKTAAAEDSFQKTMEAEEPFLKGGDVEAAEAGVAIAACKETAQAAETKVLQAASFLKAKLNDIKRFPKDSQAEPTSELQQLQNRVEVVTQKLATFKRETGTREA